LFTVAAAFNFAMAAALAFFSGELLPIPRLDPITGTSLALLYVTAALIATFGYAYACVAANPDKYRVYIPLGAIGKIAVAAVACLTWLAGIVAWRLMAMALPDAIFALLFIDYLARTTSQN
jgi:hypothetical protein